MSLTMANSMVTPDESYGFNLEWISEGTGMEEEICGVEKDCIIVPSSPVLPKIEPDDPLQTQIDEYVEIQVTEEEVVTEQQWQNQHNGLFDFSNDMDMGMRTGSEDDVPLPENQDEYSRLHPYPCDFCSRRFSKKAAMTVHMLSHQIERPHDCNLCSKSFKRKFDLVEHMKVHAYNPLKDDEDYENLSTVHEAKAKLKKKKKKVKNVVLQGLTEKKQKKPTYTHFTSALEEEMRLMVESEESDSKFPVIDPARPYVCQHCGVGFAREKALLSHNMIHAGDSAFECDKCHEMFQTERLLIQHKTKKHGRMSPLTKKKSASIPDTERLNVKEEVIDLNEEHMCQLCLIIFNTAEELVAHRADHDQDIGIHACYLCNEVIDTLEELRDHIRLRHNSTHCCVRCNKVFKDQPTLTYHLTTHEPQMMTCPICSRKFTSKLSFRKHISTHEDKQTLLCSDCGNLFMDGKSLLYHKQSEHNLNMSRLFPCMECGKTFNSRSSQQIHIRIHTGEKPYGCRFCWKAFGDGGTLRKHERIHTGEKPYVCPVCSKAFNQRVVLREHVRAHHSGNEGKLSDNCYECIVCGQLFTNSSELCAHLVQHSDENTAKHRLPTSRKAAKKRKFPPNPATRSVAIMNEVLKEDPIYEKLTSTESLTSNSSFNPIFADDTILSDEHFFVAPSPPKKKHASPIRQVREPMEVIKPSDTLDSMSSLLKSSPKRARIVRSGKKGFHKGQNKRFQKGKSKTSKLLNNSSYASKYVVSQPNDFLNDDVNFNDDLDIANSLFNEVDDFPRNRPRTKNVSYHNLKPEKLEPATFPVQAETFPKKKKKKITKTKKVKSPQKKFDLNDIHPTIDAQYVNGIDPSLFEEHNSGEPIETCIVDDFDVEFKLEDRTSDVEIIEEIDIKPELVSCDMCSEVFTNRHDLFNHVQIHI